MSAILLAYLDPTLVALLAPFMVLLLASWAIYLIKLFRSACYQPFPEPTGISAPSVSVIVPVYNEDPAVWTRVLEHLREACRGLEHEIIVVANGELAELNARHAERAGFAVRRLPEPSKRRAIALGAAVARFDVAVILDSDTLVPKDALGAALWPFADPKIGGVTPRHVVRARSGHLLRRLADWMEDNRFNEVLRGQSAGRAVACLPGRLYALRTRLLKAAATELVEQRFLGVRCISGDDRFLTSWLLAHGHQTVYQSTSVVHTEAPTTLGGLLRQRLRWARGGFRGTILALPWLWRYPYTCFTVLATILLRWALFGVLVYTAQSDELLSLVDRGERVVGSTDPVIVLASGILLFFLAGLPRRLRHLITHPQDLPYYPAFLLLVSFLLTPLSWYGNLTCWKQGWLTRRRPKGPDSALAQRSRDRHELSRGKQHAPKSGPGLARQRPDQ